ncbi:MaoC/PaaZ C-terminal domain-containing protein [Microbacterium sp. YY-03]|uniref:MaoC/PaaZ C-terminal domain-containing protein n=1 Tax=Microbacterium sp. YY-03 TaxID=3421636 RepID=UPI003D16D5CE
MTKAAGAWAGRPIGDRVVSYTEWDAILYALAVGAPADRLDLVFEDQFRVMPTFGLTLAQWAPDVLAAEGAWDNTSVHGSQKLTVHKEMPRHGEVSMGARVGNVWDKGSASIFEIEVTCEYFTATWSIFAPNTGGWGGERGAKAEPAVREGEGDVLTYPVALNSAALYRLTGDRHHIHIDPAAAARIGQEKPILQGLATIAGALIPLADAAGKHPADLVELEGRFSGMVIPGDTLQIRTWGESFDIERDGTVVIAGGKAAFA